MGLTSAIVLALAALTMALSGLVVGSPSPSGTVATNGLAAFSTSNVPARGVDDEAIYLEPSTDFSISTSSVLARSESTITPTTPGSASPTTARPLALTGADLANMIVGALALLVAGALLLMYARRRRSENRP